MGFESLLRNPERYRFEPRFKATNLVFRVRYEGKAYVVKRLRNSMVSDGLELYYVLQDRLFYGKRRWMSAVEGIREEASRLTRLIGHNVPKLYAHDDRTVVREYLEGKMFPELSEDSEKACALDGAVNALQEIHAQGIIFDNHVKNTLMNQEGVYWLDLGGGFDETNLVKAKAVGLLKFVYSTYTITEDANIAEHSAKMVKRSCSDPDVMAAVKALVEQDYGVLRLLFPTRVSRKANAEIKKILNS